MELFSDVKALCSECHNLIHAAHREHRIPWDQFDRASVFVRKTIKGKHRRIRKKRKAKAQHRTITPFLSSPQEQLGQAQKATIKAMLAEGYKPGYIAKINGWPPEEVSFIAGRIKREMKVEA
jgi:hypothetical protein